MTTTLDLATASHFARIALGHVEREYPNKLDHLIRNENDVRSPRSVHPVFYGSFDWHSCIHSYWMLATLLRRFPDMVEASSIRELFYRQLVPDKVDAELEYLEEPGRSGFARPYGLAWVLMLMAELSRHPAEHSAWQTAVRPLAQAIVRRFTVFLPRSTYPVRVGTHFNTAFAVALGIEYADQLNDKRFGRLLRGRAVSWYQNDRDCTAWEPGGDDFLSSALIEAECMRRCLSPDDFAKWMDGFLPRIVQRDPMSLFTPAVVSDRTDGKIAHLDGLNLSRAWCWRSLARVWDESDPRRQAALDAAEVHLAASLPHMTGDYMGEHWLATYATLALLAA